MELTPRLGIADWLAPLVAPFIQFNWLAALLHTVVLFLGLYAVMVVVEWRRFRFKDQFLAFLPGVPLLMVVYGVMVHMAASLPPDAGHWYQSTWFGVFCTIAAVGMVVHLTRVDIRDLRNSELGPERSFTRAQLLSPTKTWVNFGIYGCFVWLLLRVGLPAILATPWADASLIGERLIVAVLFGMWICLTQVDLKHPKHSTAHAAAPFWSRVVGVVVFWVYVILFYALFS